MNWLQKLLVLFCLVLCLTFISAACAANYKFFESEGNSLNADLLLSKESNVHLLLACTYETPRRLGVEIHIEPNAKTSPALLKLQKVAPNTTMDLDVCFDLRCKTYRWEYSDEGSDKSGGPLLTFIPFNDLPAAPHLMRLKVPGNTSENMNLEATCIRLFICPLTTQKRHDSGLGVTSLKGQ